MFPYPMSKNELKPEKMKSVLYESVVGSLIYVQTCTEPDISFIVEILDRYKNNPRLDH